MPFDVPAIFGDAWQWHRTIMEADIARNFDAFYERGRDRLSESLRGQIERGRQVSAVDYNDAVDRIQATGEAFEEVFDHCDVHPHRRDGRARARRASSRRAARRSARSGPSRACRR